MPLTKTSTRSTCVPSLSATAAVALAISLSTPAVMVKVLVDGCATGAFSACKIVNKLHELLPQRGQRFNGQTVVNGHRQIIVAAALTACGSERAELPGKLAAAVRNTGIKASRTGA